MDIQPSENHASTVRDSLSRNLIAGTAAKVGYLLTRFFIPPFVLAHVTLAAYGLWSAAFILVSYLGISTLGLSNVYVKYVAEYSARREHQRANELLSTGLSLSLPGCLILFATIYFFWPRVMVWLRIAPELQTDAREVILIVVAVFLAQISLSGFHDAIVGVQRTDLVQGTWVVGYLVEMALIFAFVGAGRGIRGLAEAYLIRTALDTCLCIVAAFRIIPWLRVSPFRFSREAARILFSFGGIVQIQSFFAIALNSIERVLAASLVGLQATGLLEISEKLPNMAGSVPMGFASALIPAASYLNAGLDGSPEQQDSLRKLYLKGCRYMNIATAFTCAFLALVPSPVLDTWVGKHYDGAAFLMIIFSIACQANLMTAPGTSILKGIGRPFEEFRYCLPNVVALLVSVPASRLILGQWTVAGIGAAVAGSTVVSAAYFLAHANRLLRIPAKEYWQRVVLPGLIPYAVAALFTPAAYYAASHTNRWVCAGVVSVLGALYSLLLLWIVARFVLDTGERLWFEAVIRNKLGRAMRA